MRTRITVIDRDHLPFAICARKQIATLVRDHDVDVGKSVRKIGFDVGKEFVDASTATR